MDNKVMLLLNTVKYLKPSQAFYRAKNIIKKNLYKNKLIKVKVPENIKIIKEKKFLVSTLDFDLDYLDRFNIEDIFSGEFNFINIKEKISLNNSWNDKSLQHLWRFNLHYFEYLYKISYEYLKDNKKNKYYNKYKELISSWILNNPFAEGDGWHPYTISLRITNWISTYEIFSDKIEKDKKFEKMINDSLYMQYKFLQENLEKDILGNHYLENIKALILGSIFFKERNIKEKFINKLEKELKEQILYDGMHFELSPMYHKVILELIIKLAIWLKNDLVAYNLYHYIQIMVNVMYSFEKDFGKTPSFNDSTDGVSKTFTSILKVARDEFNIRPEFIGKLEKSGYYILDKDKYKLIFDVGEISPKYLPGHGHCDALSYELSMDNNPILVNSGTYLYEPGKWRDYFRKTKSHNTVTINGKDQSQYWSSFRVAKRIKNVKRKSFRYKEINFVAGSYDSYSGDNHKRFIGELDKNTLLVLDKISDGNKKDAKSYIHMVPECEIEIDKKIKIQNKERKIYITPFLNEEVKLKNGWYSKKFNFKEKNKYLQIRKDKKSDFFGYLISFNDYDHEIEEKNGILKIKSIKDHRINLKNLQRFLI